MRDVQSDSIQTVLRRLAANIAALLQTYAILAGQETRATVRDVATGVLFLAAAALLGGFALALTVVAAVLLLSLVLQPWEAALIVLAVAGLVMVLLIELGLGRLRRRRLQRVVEAFKEDLRWLRRALLERD
jgi:Flp pilus assembly protein TadB